MTLEVQPSDLPSRRTCWKAHGWLTDSRWAPLESIATSNPSPPYSLGGSQAMTEPGGDSRAWSLLPVGNTGWAGQGFLRLHCNLILLFPILSPSPSPFKAARPASQTGGSPRLLLCPLSFVFHRHYPQSLMLHSLSWLFLLRGLGWTEHSILASWICFLLVPLWTYFIYSYYAITSNRKHFF